ncbi:MAG: class I SAM-dependent methyltransferase [Acidobacteria bacterium]|nr:class I SAM-dependent methyltransferase [Acidobacteriota bacterium]
MIPARRKKPKKSPAPVHPFDAQHGTETGSLIPGDDLATGHHSDRHITAYHGTSPSLFEKLLTRWRDDFAKHPLEKTAFIDIGAGKGRAMLLAGEHPFRRIAGVELHPGLAARARENIDLWRATHEDAPAIALFEQDVLRMRIPAGPCLFFLFNPFGAYMMDMFLTRLRREFASRPGECDLLYVNDEQWPLMEEAHPQFKQLWRGRIHLSRADAAADRATIKHDADGIYVTTGYEDCSIYRLMKR